MLPVAVALLSILISPADSAVAAGANAAATGEPVPDFGLTELAELLHRDVAATAAFSELQYRHVLKQPLARSGELHFEPPGRFEKRVLSPVIETYRIDGETLSMELPKRATRQISLRNQPLLGGLLLGFKAIISGRLDTLASTFDTTVSGSATDWRLELRPTQADVARYIESIHVSGRGSEPQRFEVLERSGDRTVTIMEPRR
jgi:Outer membrane lipoprotein carrier protein LolA-like